jgi:O-antigen/teichoic acid export membrane protein
MRTPVRGPVTASPIYDRAMIREALPIAGSQVLWVFRTYLPTLALWVMAARESVGRFDVAHRVLLVCQAMLTMYLTNLFTPLSKAAHAPRRRFVGLLLGSSAFATASALAGAALLNIRPGPLLGVLWGKGFNAPESAAALALLAFVVPVITLRGHAHYALVALGRQRRELVCALAGCVLLVALLVLWVPAGGTRAAALAMLVSESFGLVLTWLALADVLRRRDAVPEEARAAWLS